MNLKNKKNGNPTIHKLRTLQFAFSVELLYDSRSESKWKLYLRSLYTSTQPRWTPSLWLLRQT